MDGPRFGGSFSLIGMLVRLGLTESYCRNTPLIGRVVCFAALDLYPSHSLHSLAVLRGKLLYGYQHLSLF